MISHRQPPPTAAVDSAYLTDDQVWLCVCAARLAELDAGHARLAGPDHDAIARRLLADGWARTWSAIEAAERWHRAGARAAA
jgi:hypothetical protein